MSSHDQPLFTWRGAVTDCQLLKATTKHVLLTIATHMNGRGEGCYPTIAQLKYETGLSNRTICTHIQIAVGAGWLAVKKRGNAGQNWANHEYYPVVPPGHVRITFRQSKITQGSEEGSSPSFNEAVKLTAEADEPSAEGSEPKSKKVVKKVHTSSSISSSVSSSVSQDNRVQSEGSGELKRDDGKSLTTLSGGESERLFEEWWHAYPKKRNRKGARQAWLDLNPDKELAHRIISVTKLASRSAEWTKDHGRYVPHPGNWLVSEGWADEYQELGKAALPDFTTAEGRVKREADLAISDPGLDAVLRGHARLIGADEQSYVASYKKGLILSR